MAQVSISNTYENEGDASSITVADVVVAADEGLLVSIFLEVTDSGKEVSTVFWDVAGVNQELTEFNDYSPSHGKLRHHTYFLASPTAKTAIITVTLVATNKVGVCVHTVANHHTTTMLSGVQTEEITSGATDNVSITQDADDLAFVCGAHFTTAGNMAVESGETLLNNLDVAGTFKIFNGYEDGDGATTVGWSGGGGNKECSTVGFVLETAPSGTVFDGDGTCAVVVDMSGDGLGTRPANATAAFAVGMAADATKHKSGSATAAFNVDASADGTLPLTLHQEFRLNAGSTMANAALVGPTFTLVRGSDGSYWNESGVLVTATANNPRNDHEPVGAHKPIGILREEERINSCRQSEDLGTTWAVTGDLTTNTDVAPDGNTTADKLDDTSTSFTRFARQSITVANNETWGASFFIKKDSTPKTTRSSRLQVEFFGGTTSRMDVRLDTSTGEIHSVLVSGSATLESSGIKDCGDYWQVWLVGTNDATGNSQLRVFFVPASGLTGDLSQTTATATGSAICWGVQVEKLAATTDKPSSYIKTTTIAVTRSADVITTTDLTWLNSDQGTLYVEGRFPHAQGGERTLFSIDDGSALDRLRLYLDAAENVNFETINSADTDGASDHSAVIGENAEFKAAGAYADDDVIVAVNGSSAAQDVTAGIPVNDAATIARFGDDSVGTPYNGHIAALKYFAIRKNLIDALTDYEDGAATAALTVGMSGDATRSTVGAGTAALDVDLAGAPSGLFAAKATAALTVGMSAAATEFKVGSATAAFQVDASADGERFAKGDATAAFDVDISGSVGATFAALATAAFDLDVAGNAVKFKSGDATAAFVLDMAADATIVSGGETFQGAGTCAFVIDAAADGVRLAKADAIAAISVDMAADADRLVGAAAGTCSFDIDLAGVTSEFKSGAGICAISVNLAADAARLVGAASGTCAFDVDLAGVSTEFKSGAATAAISVDMAADADRLVGAAAGTCSFEIDLAGVTSEFKAGAATAAMSVDMAANADRLVGAASGTCSFDIDLAGVTSEFKAGDGTAALSVDMAADGNRLVGAASGTCSFDIDLVGVTGEFKSGAATAAVSVDMAADATISSAFPGAGTAAFDVDAAADAGRFAKGDATAALDVDLSGAGGGIFAASATVTINFQMEADTSEFKNAIATASIDVDMAAKAGVVLKGAATAAFDLDLAGVSTEFKVGSGTFSFVIDMSGAPSATFAAAASAAFDVDSQADAATFKTGTAQASFVVDISGDATVSEKAGSGTAAFDVDLAGSPSVLFAAKATAALDVDLLGDGVRIVSASASPAISVDLSGATTEFKAGAGTFNIAALLAGNAIIVKAGAGAAALDVDASADASVGTTFQGAAELAIVVDMAANATGGEPLFEQEAVIIGDALWHDPVALAAKWHDPVAATALFAPKREE